MSAPHGLFPHHVALLREVFARHAPPVERVDLFGSRAVGAGRANSDLDLVVSGTGVNGPLLDRLWTELNDLPIPLTIDVLADEGPMPAALRAHIEAVRIPLLVFDESRTA